MIGDYYDCFDGMPNYPPVSANKLQHPIDRDFRRSVTSINHFKKSYRSLKKGRFIMHIMRMRRKDLLISFFIIYMLFTIVFFLSGQKKLLFGQDLPLDTEKILKYSTKEILIEKKSNMSRSFGIPKIIHQSWKTSKIPYRYATFINSCIKTNKDFKYWFWTDADIQDFVKTYFPDLLDSFNSYPKNIYRVDIFRLLAIYKYGGVYLDIDIKCLNPLSKLIVKHDCLFAQEPLAHVIIYNKTHVPWLSNFLIACRPNHPFIYKYIETILTSPFNQDPVQVTGPGPLNKLYASFRDSKSEYLPTTEHYNAFGTTIDWISQLYELCNDDEYIKSLTKRPNMPTLNELKEGCSSLMYGRTNHNSTVTNFVDHQYSHLWMDDSEHEYSLKISISDILEDKMLSL